MRFPEAIASELKPAEWTGIEGQSIPVQREGKHKSSKVKETTVWSVLKRILWPVCRACQAADAVLSSLHYLISSSRQPDEMLSPSPTLEGNGWYYSFTVYYFFFPLKFFEKQLAFQGRLILGKAYSEVQKLLFFMF